MNFSTLRLRPYQEEAQRAIVESRRRGSNAQLVSLATGLGKTVIIATLPDLLELRPTDVTLVIAHRDELISQLVDKMRAQNPNAVVGVEKADEIASESCSIIVATVQTLTGSRLARFATRFGRRIALFVIDEAHHAAAPTYRAILEKVVYKRPDALVIGFTATPQRGDGVELNEIFPNTVYEMDARAAIDAGYLVPVRSFAVATDVDLDGVSSRAGDFVIGQLADAVDTQERNAAVLEAYQTLTPGMKALVFTASVEHARNVAELFKAQGLRAAFASGDTPRAEREKIVAGFRGDTVDVLVNCGLYLEGFDVPSVQAIINARPTKSTTLYTQVTGRGLRPLDEDAYFLSHLPTPVARRDAIAQSRKPYAMIVDIVDKARRHQLVTLPTLWGLPGQIDALGRPISDVAKSYEELFAKAPREAARVRNADQIENALLELSSAGKAKNVAWQMVTPEHWRLEQPLKRVARTRKGRIIAHFDQKFSNFVKMAKRIAPHENAEAFALRMLDVDRRSVTEESQVVDITRRGEVWIATFDNGRGAPRDLVSAATLPDAIAAATARIEIGDPFASDRRPNHGKKRPPLPQNGVPGGKPRFRGRKRLVGSGSATGPNPPANVI